MSPEEARAVATLRAPETIRERCARLLSLALRGALDEFEIRLDLLDGVVDRVVALTRARYPDLAVPYHSRWRHFDAGGVPRLARLDAALATRGADEAARARIDLAVVSVLLDAGAGPRWRYTDAAGHTLGRSEGLAVASLELFLAGAFSSDPAAPLRADAAGLEALEPARLAAALQVREDNPLVGLEGRAALLNSLGAALRADPERFGADPPRPGGLLDALRGEADGDRIPARALLASLLEGLGSIWPGRVRIGDVNLGDVWPHPALSGPGLADRYVPFHKLSQWLAYSLFEPLEAAGLTVTGADELTALAEYRNAGLLLDAGVLVPRDPGALERAHLPAAPIVVAWRALAVALVDRLAPVVRERLGVAPEEFPLARVLEGGTWAAGRAIAHERRPDGRPPLTIISDGTVF
ncbi:MAG: DUF1688 family protein [Planctomycetota bacterium]|nr:MAG: DUF1688 family protein [Planctomycetota bacterium]